MKKITAILTALALLSCSLVACGSGDDEDNSKSSKKASPSQTEEPTEPADSEPAHHKALNKFFNSVNDKNIEDCTKFIVPQAFLNVLSDSELDKMHENVSGLIDFLNESYEKENGKNVRYSVVEFLSEKPLTDGQLTNAENYFYDNFAMDESIELTLTEGYEIDFTLETTGDDKTSTEELKMCLVKIDKDGWKVYMDDADSLDDEPDYQEPTTEPYSTAPTVTTEIATGEPSTLAYDEEFTISSMPSLDFISMVSSLHTMNILDKYCFFASIPMLPTDIYNDLNQKDKSSEFDQAMSPYLSEMSAAIVDEGSNTTPTLVDVTDTKLLTTEELI
ncbi:MAG: hypothetical protein GXY08_02950, partial [Ruminococcus sp.]|nr:hypothetical protein [Ruminococcus sp.]